MPKKVLAVVSSTQTTRTGKQTGYTLEELAAPYVRFVKAGFDVDIASPLGGRVAHDPAYASGIFLSQDGEALLEDKMAQSKLANTISIGRADPNAYAGVFLVGGVAAAGDFDANPVLDQLLAAVLRNGGALAAVCHGVVGLTNLKLKDGSLAVQGHPMTGFSRDEEVAANLLDDVAVVPEIRIRDRGGQYCKADEAWSVCVVEGPCFITGQNPASAAGTAEALIRRMRPV